MGRQNLVIFTNNFPFGSGEAFIENELPIIAPNFERVIVISAAKEAQKTRQLPQNCSLFRQPITKNKFLRFSLIARYSALACRLIAAEKPWLETNNKKTNNLRLKSLLTMILHGEERLLKARLALVGLKAEETVLYSYWMDNGAYIIARLKEENPAFRAICRAHGCDLFTERAPGNYLPLRKYLIDNIDKIVFISKFGQNYFQEKHPLAKNLALSYLGTINNYKPDLALLAPKDNNGWHEILSVSNVIPLKRIDLIIKALAKCHSKWRWRHIGAGPEMSALKELAQKELEGERHIKYEFLGLRPNSRILELYQKERPDFFITTSSSEGLPVSIMEAISFGVPVIATKICGIPEIVDKKLGVLLPENPTPEEIANILDELATLPGDKYHAMRLAARAKWEKEFKAQTNYQKFLPLLLGD